MKFSKLATIAVAVLVLASGLAVAGGPGSGNAPDDAGAAADDRPEAGPHGNASATAHDAHEDQAAGAANADEAAADGPAVDLPDHVPAHVHEIHETIRAFIAGSLDGTLGEHVSDIAADNDAGEDAESSGDQTDESDG